MNAWAWHRTLALAALVAAAAHGAAAQGPRALPSAQVLPHGFVVTRPSANAASKRDGLQFEIDSRWVNNYGYRPVKIRIRSLKPAKRDHLITVKLYATPWHWQTGAVGVEQDLELPTGGTLAEATLSCPQYQTGHRYWWEVWVDGVQDESLSVDPTAAWQLASSGANSPTDPLKFLLVDPRASVGNSSVIPNADAFEAISMPIDDLPRRWIDFTAIDVLVLSVDDLEALESRHPETLGAIRRWTRAGGQMWISPVGQRLELLDRVEQLLEIPPSDAGPTARGWQPIPLGNLPQSEGETTFLHLPTGQTRVVRDVRMIERLESDPDWTITHQITSPRIDDASRKKLPSDSREWYVQQPLGFGTVRVFREAWDPIGFGISLQMLRGLTTFDPEEVSGLATPLAAAMETTRNWESRHGMTPDTANTDFADLLVPGVGQAPVNEFRVLITLFVLVIGPLNYWLLQRSGRLHLLVLTVPLTAAALTLGLFGYALVSDGLGTKVRVRSFTRLDQQTGEAACWARLSYYSGLAPARGLAFPDDVAVYPILPGWNETGPGGPFGEMRQLEWSGGRQRLTEGWLRSRTPTQYLAIRARNSPARLQLKPSANRMVATNELGAGIRYVAVANDAGDVFVADAIEEGATTELQKSDRAQVLARLQQFVRENAPSVPEELASDGSYFSSQQRRRQRRYLRDNYRLTYGLERLGGNLQNGAVEALVGTDQAPALDLPPRNFVAITDSGPEVALGVAQAREEASFHVLVGNW